MNVHDIQASVFDQDHMNRLSKHRSIPNHGVKTSKILSDEVAKSNESENIAAVNNTNISETTNFEALLSSLMTDDKKSASDSNDLTSILLSKNVQSEYLNSQSGRDLLISMAQNNIAGIISETNKS